MSNQLLDAAARAGEADLTKYQMHRYVWRGSNWEAKVDPARCAASVADAGRGCRFHQCFNTRIHSTNPGGPIEWCTTHNPATGQKKRAKAAAKYRGERERLERQGRIRRLAEEIYEAALDPTRLHECGALALERQALIAEETA